MEREIIRNRVIAGLQNARAKGKLIGRVRKRNSALINSLLDAGLSYREISRIAKCSHGSVGAQRKEWLAKKAAEKKKLEEEQKAKFENAVEISPEVLAHPQAATAQETTSATSIPAASIENKTT